MIYPIFNFIAVISPSVHESLQITDHEFPLMHYTKLISEENFTPGCPLVIVLPLEEGVSSNKEVGYLIQELHNSGRWPLLVYNVSNMMDEIMYTEIHQHCSYIILVSGPCASWKYISTSFRQQVEELSEGSSTGYSWNPRAKFVASVMSNYTHFENEHISKIILEILWFNEVMNATVRFLKSNRQAGNDLQQIPTDSEQGTYVELHTGHPYENSDRCYAAIENVTLKVFTVRNLSDIRRSGIFRGYFHKNFHGCPFNVFIRELNFLVHSSSHILHNDSKHQYFYVEESELELVRVIGKALNMQPHFVRPLEGGDMEFLKDVPFIVVGSNTRTDHPVSRHYQTTRSFLPIDFVWYTPCAVKYQRWSRFFHIFSVNMWICFTLSLVLAVITACCISNYGHNSHLHQSKAYSNILSATSNIIAVSLSVSVNTQPRSAPLRLFFFCWVCYSVAISTVFQAYLTTFLIEPGYEEPIKTLQEMLKSEKKFGFCGMYEIFINFSPDPVYPAISKDAVDCPDEPTCFMWAVVYHNFSTFIKGLDVEIYRASGDWTDENNRPLLCEIEGGIIGTVELAIVVKNGFPFFDFIDDVLAHVIEGGIFMHIKKRNFHKLNIESQFDVPTFSDTYYAIRIRDLQTAFYLLMMGYILAGVCFVSEIMWHRYRSNRHGPTNRSLCVTERHK